MSDSVEEDPYGALGRGLLESRPGPFLVPSTFIAKDSAHVKGWNWG